MADELNEDIVQLTKFTLRKAMLEQDKEWVKLSEKEQKARDAEIEQLTEQIKLKQKDVEVGKRTTENISKELASKKALQKLYEDQIKIIKQSGTTIKEQTKAIEELQRATGQRNKDITVGNVFGALKGLNFGKASLMFTEAGKAAGLASNTIKALGGAAGITTASITLLAKGAQMFWDNFLVPSARMRNIAGQQLGLAAGSRNLWGGHWIHEWSDRTLLGYSAEEQQGLYSSLVDALRINPNEEGATEQYQNAMRGMMANQRLFGTSTGSMNKIYKAFDQTGVATAQLSEKFYTLMRGVEGTGWTTSEYSDTLARNIMYLKNFGINIDTYSKNLLNYGQAIRKEILTPEEISPKMRGEGSGEMAFVAQQMLKSGVLSEKTLGAGLGDSIFKQSGALRKLAFSDPQRFRQLLYKLYTTDPRYKSLLMNAGVWGDETAMWEFMYKINAPGMGALSEMGYKGPNAFFQIAKGNLGSTPSTGLGDVKAQPEIVSDAMRNVAQMTTGFKALLVAIASMITDFSKTLPEDNPQGFNVGTGGK